MGAVVDLCTYAQRHEAACNVARCDGPEPHGRQATLLIDGEPYLTPATEVESMKPGDLVDVGFLAVVSRIVAFRDGRICVHLTKRLAYGRLQLVQS
jgi:hypothetical protein